MFKSTINKLGKHKAFIQNLSYLSVLQVINLILPLLTYPYLIRVLGDERYGLVVFSQSVVGFLVIIVSFGFNISATKEISINRNDEQKVSEIVSSTLLIKFVLFIFSMLILVLLIYVLPQAKNYQLLFILSMWMCLYEVMFPLWYFQGIEKMKYITFITLFTRVLFLALIFIFVRSPEDYLYLPIINGIGALIAGIVSLYIIFKLHKVKFTFVSFSIAKGHLQSSLPIFISRISSFKDYTPSLLIGLFINTKAVAYYDLATKLVGIINAVFDNITSVTFPMIARERNFGFLKRIIRIEVMLLTLSYLLINLFGSQVISILGGASMMPAKPLLFITGFLLIRPLSSIIGSNILVINGLTREFVLNLLYSTIFYFIITLLIIGLKQVNIYTLSSTLVLSLMFELVHRLYLIKKNNLIHWVL